MSWKQWTAVVVVIGLGIVGQIPRDDEMEESPRPEQTAAPAAAGGAPVMDGNAPAGPYRTIALEVTGMT